MDALLFKALTGAFNGEQEYPEFREDMDYTCAMRATGTVLAYANKYEMSQVGEKKWKITSDITMDSFILLGLQAIRIKSKLFIPTRFAQRCLASSNLSAVRNSE